MYVKSKGAEKLEPMNTGGTVATADFELTLVNALHSSSRDVYLGNPNGIIVRPKEGKTLYHMGDTDMFGGMALIAEFHKPDDRHRADRRPLHHGRQVGRVHLQEVLRLRDDPALPLRHLSRACSIPMPTSSLPR